MRVLLTTLLFVAGCYRDGEPLPPMPPYPTDTAVGADAGARCEVACARLRDIGCPEGSTSCAAGCVRMSAAQPLPLDCWADAGDQFAARSCGGLRCQ